MSFPYLMVIYCWLCITRFITNVWQQIEVLFHSSDIQQYSIDEFSVTTTQSRTAAHMFYNFYSNTCISFSQYRYSVQCEYGYVHWYWFSLLSSSENKIKICMTSNLYSLTLEDSEICLPLAVWPDQYLASISAAVKQQVARSSLFYNSILFVKSIGKKDGGVTFNQMLGT